MGNVQAAGLAPEQGISPLVIEQLRNNADLSLRMRAVSSNTFETVWSSNVVCRSPFG